MRLRKKHTSLGLLTTLRLEGGLFLPDQLEKAALGNASFQTLADYQLPAGLKLRDEYSRAFQIATALYKPFAEGFEREDTQAMSVTLTFVQRLLIDVLDYKQLQVLTDGITLHERTWKIALMAGNVPIIVAPHTQDLDKADERFAVIGSGARKKSPFQLAQEFLNASDDHLWAMVTNGKQLRLLRDADTLTRPSYVEFDLQDMLARLRYSEFEMAWRILHASRSRTAGDSVWELWRHEGQDQGTRVRDGLRQGVTSALLAFGEGFVKHPSNDALRTALDTGALTHEAYFNELLRLIYRLIFLFTVEERGLLHSKDTSKSALTARTVYAQGYAMARLRGLSLKRRAKTAHGDLWQGTKVVFRALANGEDQLALTALGGLFDSQQCPHLDSAQLSNAHLLTAMQALRWSNSSGSLAPVDYRNMDSEELGSVYESLLELVPQINLLEKSFTFIGLNSADNNQGNARKTSGSYYTPDSLVQELIQSALLPALDKKLADNSQQPVQALLSMSIIDPACGSGHFLLAAARKLAERLAVLRSIDGVVKPEDYRLALRDVIANCIYGVDRNPMAIELARTALWLEGYAEDAPLSFLDHHLQVGDALLGITDFSQLMKGIPKTAFKALSGDDKEICRTLTAANRTALRQFEQDQLKVRIGDKDLRDGAIAFDVDTHVDQLKKIEAMPERTTKQIAAKEVAYRDFLHSAKDSKLNHAANMLVGAFLLPKNDPNHLTSTPTSASLYLELFTQPDHSQHLVQRQTANAVCEQARVHHWPLAFPQVFAKGGFDCVLANPPWERIKLQEEEFFATRNLLVAEAKNKAERSQRIQWLSEGMLAKHLYPEVAHSAHECEAEQRLFAEFITARRTAEAASVFMHVDGDDAGRYALTGVGDVNTYALFAETISQIVSKTGRAGFIVPTGIATDDSTKLYFGHIATSGQLASLYDFENREAIFAGVHRSYKFCLITLGQAEEAEFAFFLSNTNQLGDARRKFRLTPSEFALINPNTRTCPVFRSNKDAELTKKIYRQVPVLIQEAKGLQAEINPWGISFMAMMHMSNDSHLFKDSPQADDLPLYEAKMIHQFDHRWASYASNSEGGVDSGDVPLCDKQNPHYSVTPRYWVAKQEVKTLLSNKNWDKGWLMGWRDITNATNERTVIASVIPRVGVGHKMPLYFARNVSSVEKLSGLLANFSSIVFDYISRQKMGGTSLTYHYLKQFPVLPPDLYTEADLTFIVPRVLELTYTAWDMQPWAQDLGYEGAPFAFDPDRRAQLRAELDAYYARLYQLTREELQYILDPASIMGDDYPSETFRGLKNKEMRNFGEYRTQRMVLEAWDKLASGELS